MSKQTFTVRRQFNHTSGRWDDPNRQSFVTETDVVIEIDLGEIARHYGLKALTNKSGKARALSGAVIVRCKNARRIDPVAPRGIRVLIRDAEPGEKLGTPFFPKAKVGPQ